MSECVLHVHHPHSCSQRHDVRFCCITHKQEPGLKTASARGANYSGTKYVEQQKAPRSSYSVIRAQQHCYIAGALEIAVCARKILFPPNPLFAFHVPSKTESGRTNCRHNRFQVHFARSHQKWDANPSGYYI